MKPDMRHEVPEFVRIALKEKPGSCDHPKHNYLVYRGLIWCFFTRSTLERRHQKLTVILTSIPMPSRELERICGFGLEIVLFLMQTIKNVYKIVYETSSEAA